MSKVLLILESEVMQKLLSETLPDYEFCTCPPGEAADILQQSQQDALLLEIMDKEAMIENLLGQFHIHAKERVMKALVRAILMVAEDPDCLLTKDIYLTLCKEYGTTTDGVDQAIRRCLRNTWHNRQRHPAAWEAFFPGCNSCPTNGAFIATLAAYLRKKYPSRFRKGS